MYNNKAHSQYKNIQVSTVDRGRLLLMMYDGGIKFLNQAKDGLQEKNLQKFARFLSKSQAIIAELQNTLDFEKGGDIAKDLDRLYEFMLFYLTEANLEKSTTKIQRVIELLTTLHNAYRDIIESGKAAKELESLPVSEQPKTKNPTPSKSTEDGEKKSVPQVRVAY